MNNLVLMIVVVLFDLVLVAITLWQSKAVYREVAQRQWSLDFGRATFLLREELLPGKLVTVQDTLNDYHNGKIEKIVPIEGSDGSSYRVITPSGTVYNVTKDQIFAPFYVQASGMPENMELTLK